MGNSLSSTSFCVFKKQAKSLLIDIIFKFPSPTPSWPSPEEGGFGSGYIDLGGLLVHQISTFNKIWSIKKGGLDNLGATFFEPSQIPDGFFMLGCYAQLNNQPLFGWTLVAKDVSDHQSGIEILKKPTDYTLVWSSKYLKSSQDGHGYIWLPTAPDGYRSVGYVVTNMPEKLSPDHIICILAEFTDELELADWG